MGFAVVWLRFSQPTMQPIIGVTCTFLEGLTQQSATCKLVKVGDSHSLKRLASAVQLRPWPPCFQSVNYLRKANHVSKRCNSLGWVTETASTILNTSS